MTSIPDIPEGLSKCRHAGVLVEIWKNKLRMVSTEEKTETLEAPKIILAVQFMKMVNLIPQDSIHPLYSPSCSDLISEFILDHISTQNFDDQDPSLNSDDGLLIKSMSDKSLIFKRKNGEDKYYVNDIEVLGIEKLPDQTTLVIGLDDFLFDHQQKVQEAWQALKRSS